MAVKFFMASAGLIWWEEVDHGWMPKVHETILIALTMALQFTRVNWLRFKRYMAVFASIRVRSIDPIPE